MHVGLIPPPPANGNHSFGFLMQTMLYLSNYTDHGPNNSLHDYYHLPIGAGTGKHDCLADARDRTGRSGMRVKAVQ